MSGIETIQNNSTKKYYYQNRYYLFQNLMFLLLLIIAKISFCVQIYDYFSKHPKPILAQIKNLPKKVLFFPLCARTINIR